MTDDTTERQQPKGPVRSRLRRPAALLGAVALVAAGAAAVTVGSPAQASDTPKTALGKEGQELSVSASADIDPAGETLRVTGEGYDDTKGVYLAVCKDNGDNRIPTPCLGGADQSGSSGASVWIIPRDASDEGAGTIAERWGEGGTFDLDLTVKAKDSGLDCLAVACSVVTRVDHNGSGDRSQDVRVPITFTGQDPGDGGGDGVDVPAGTVSYVRSAEFTTAGRPLDLLLHPDSGKLYVGSDNIPDTSDVAEQGLYVLDAQDGKVLSHIAQAPGPNGAMAARVVRRIAAPLPGDGVVFHYPLRGIGTAKDGDPVAQGVWFTGATFTGIGQDADTSTVLVAAGPELRRVETATGVVKDTVTLAGGNQLGVDAARGAAWSVGTSEGRTVLRRVDTDTFEVTATAELPTDSVFFVEPDPATGNVWVASGTSVLVFDKDGKPLTTLTGADRPTAAAFDQATGRAFVLREDLADSASDQTGSLQILDGAAFGQVAEPVALPGSLAGAFAGIAVAPGATSVYLTKQAESKVVKLDALVSPKVTQSPTDQSVAPGDEVTFVAAAEGTPEPTVRWQVSPDGGQTWSAVEGATKNAYSFTAKAAQDGYAYRAEFTNSVGTTRTSPITLTVTEASGDGGTTTGGGDGEDTEPSGSRTVTGPEGQKLTVTPVNNLATEDQTLKVTGSGYDVDKGIYVALCVDNGEGELPTPCVGGVDMSGESHSSAWISSNPPDYGEELAIPYKEGGAFEVELTVDAEDEFTDCFEATCVLATRADHTLSGDRSQDVKVPVAFVGQDPVDTDPGTGDTGSTGGSSTTGSTGTTGGSASGSTTGSATGGTGTSTAGDSLASTGVTVVSAAALAAALVAAGWVAYRRARTTTDAGN